MKLVIEIDLAEGSPFILGSNLKEAALPFINEALNSIPDNANLRDVFTNPLAHVKTFPNGEKVAALSQLQTRVTAVVHGEHVELKDDECKTTLQIGFVSSAFIPVDFDTRAPNVKTEVEHVEMRLPSAR